MLVFQPMYYHRSFKFYLHRSCRGGTPAAGTTRTGLFLERRENARVFTGKLYPPAQKKEARKRAWNRLHVRYAPKTRILLPTLSFRNRGRTCAIRNGSIRPLLIGFVGSITPSRPPPLCLSFCRNHLLGFLMAIR